MKKFLILGLALWLSGCELPQADTTESTPTVAQTQTQTTETKTPALAATVKAITSNNQEFVLEVAQDRAAREKGLMNRESLDENTGMLFVFDAPGNHGFWMKNTLIPLDIIWLSKSQQVIHYVQAQPCTTENCTVYRPSPTAQAAYVVELNPGPFDGKIGDFINF